MDRDFFGEISIVTIVRADLCFLKGRDYIWTETFFRKDFNSSYCKS
jgi:hypothetical protein